MNFDNEKARGHVNAQGHFSMMIKEVEVNRLKDPPPPPPKKPVDDKPKPEGPPKIGPKLD